MRDSYIKVMSVEDKNTTHFGYKEVATKDKAKHVAAVFDLVANKYDLMNDLMSMGIHRLWKLFTIHISGVRCGAKVLDIAGGTGDLALKFSKLVGSTGTVVLADINASMINVGRDRLTDKGITGNIHYVQANVECLPVADNSFDCITIAFGLRNVTNKDAALRSMLRALKPGGQVLILEFSKPAAWLAPIYDAYSFKLLPKIGKIFSNNEKSYRYLAESIRKSPDQQTLKQMMADAGFKRCDFNNMSAGIVALHSGYKF